MFGPRKHAQGRLILLLLVPGVLCLAYLLVAHTTNPKASAPPLARKVVNPNSKPPEPNLAADLDHDGFPDVSELRTFNDRESFRRWFAWIAEMQFYKLNDQWNPDQRDCAGLVRFAWREALRPHDRAWYQRMGVEYESVAPDPSLTLDAEPLRGKPFRTSPGAYHASDIQDARFSEFADGRTLKLFNADFVSLDRKQARPGDLIFFHQPWVQKFPYHVMIFLGEARLAGEDVHDWVVYHTGASAEDAGTVKKVRLAVLDGHPNKRWRPIPINPNFLGFYRPKILNQQLNPEE